MSEYDGSGWGHGELQPWSHYVLGDRRCDAKPTLNATALMYECKACAADQPWRWVFSVEYAAANRLLDYAPPERPEPDIPPMTGFARIRDGQSNHWYYERIGPPPDFREVHRDGLRSVRRLHARGEWQVGRPVTPWRLLLAIAVVAVVLYGVSEL